MIEFNLKKVLEEKKVSLYKLEKDTKLSSSVLWKYKKGDVQRVDLTVLDKICNALDCVPSDLIGFEKNKPVESSK